MHPFDEISLEKIASFYQLMNFLKRLRTIGHLETTTVRSRTWTTDPYWSADSFTLDEFFEHKYSIIKEHYINDKNNFSSFKKN